MTKFGTGKNERNRSCNPDWFTQHKWLHYDLTKNSLFCYPCNKAYVHKKLFTNNLEKTFITGEGFSKWNKATGKDGKLIKHEKSDCHIEAVSKFSEITATNDIGCVMSNEYREREEQNRKCLKIIIEYVRVLARQSLALRGHESEFNSNLHQFLLVEARKNSEFSKWLNRKTCRYTSPKAQNELLKIMALDILRSVVEKIKASHFYSIMADETADVSNIEQLSFCIRSVDSNFNVSEDFIGLHECENTRSNHLLEIIKKILMSCNFDFSKIRGQCYDKAASMSGEKTGVKTQVLKEENRALYIHCFNHALNLGVCDTMKNIKLLKDTLSFAEELIVLIHQKESIC